MVSRFSMYLICTGVWGLVTEIMQVLILGMVYQKYRTCICSITYRYTLVNRDMIDTRIQ